MAGLSRLPCETRPGVDLPQSGRCGVAARATRLAQRSGVLTRQVQHPTTNGWPWRAGNEFEFLADGAQFFARMLDSIGAARAYVLLELYLVNSGGVATRFIEALLQARSRGVHVYAAFDGFGALGLKRADR